MTGRVLGDRYQIQQQLSKGVGRGTLLALDLVTHAWVVIKLLLCRNQFETEDLKLFRREAETLRSLNHPAIPQYLDYFELTLPDGRGFALVQTHIVGKSLQSYLDAGRSFSEAEAQKIAIAVLEILIYLHQQKPPIIHRDINPSNILLAAERDQEIGQVYLIDFKSAQNFAATETGSYTITGTYGYTPPEQAGGRAVNASDLYSLGATLIATLTGTEPSKLARKGLRIEFEQEIYLNPIFSSWLKRMVEPSLDKRFTSARQALLTLSPQELIRTSTSKLPQKPVDSQIGFTKTSHAIDILMPQRFSQRRLRIDAQRFAMVDEMLGCQYRQLAQGDRTDIQRLETTQTQLLIWVGSHSYVLNGKHPLTIAELDWLAYELSQWLKLPVKRLASKID
jgi:serine/threonine protein kinase